ncbi:MAG: type II and III secretion system protein family protein [Terriglobales bacterium]
MKHSSLLSTPWPLNGILLGLGVLMMAPGAGPGNAAAPVRYETPIAYALPAPVLAIATPLALPVPVLDPLPARSLRLGLAAAAPLPPRPLTLVAHGSAAVWPQVLDPLAPSSLAVRFGINAAAAAPPPMPEPALAPAPQGGLDPVFSASGAASLPACYVGGAPPMPPPEPSPPPREAPVTVRLATPIALHLAPHGSLLVSSAEPLQRVALADDTIAKAIVVSPHQLLVEGRSPGEVSLLVWAGAAEPRTYDVHVALDPTPLQQELRRLYPQQKLQVTSSGTALTVAGVVPTAALGQQVLNVAAGFAPKIVNDLSLDPAPDPGEVLLQVRFAEVDRSAVTQLGANLISTAPAMVGSESTGQFGPPANVTVPAPSQALQGTVSGKAAAFALNDLLNVFLFSRGANLGLLLQSLQQKNLLQILAEPNLVAMSGKQASFLAGGEFPFPVVQGQGVVNNVTIQFKPYGINLHFTPNILPDGTIELQVTPEVSALDYSNAVTMSGFVIPALTTRRASTDLELRDGQSFVIAGLLDNRLTTIFSKIPGLSSIPVLGKFFESRSTNKSRTELMVVVTAHLLQSNSRPHPLVMPQPFLNPQQFDGKAAGR